MRSPQRTRIACCLVFSSTSMLADAAVRRDGGRGGKRPATPCSRNLRRLHVHTRLLLSGGVFHAAARFLMTRATHTAGREKHARMHARMLIPPVRPSCVSDGSRPRAAALPASRCLRSALVKVMSDELIDLDSWKTKLAR
jgi:hypothetical protein